MNIPVHPVVMLGDLRISTDIALNPEFSDNPIEFAASRDVRLVSRVLPEVSFKKDRETDGKVESIKANIHLVSPDAIRLFIKDHGGVSRLHSIDIKVGELLYGNKEHHITDQDLESALDLLRSHVAPLLADPRDVSHILPGHANQDEEIANWSKITSRTFLPGLQIASFHDLSHPRTGPAAGSAKGWIRLEDRNGKFSILFEKAQWPVGPAGKAPIVNGVCVTLCLKGKMARSYFPSIGRLECVEGMNRLASFRCSDVSEVFMSTMRELTGTYLPIPLEWENLGKPVTRPKVMALLNQLTGIPIDDLKNMNEQVSDPSASTRKRLKADIRKASAWLKPVPVSTLFEEQ
jgi:hypothetical protein